MTLQVQLLVGAVFPFAVGFLVARWFPSLEVRCRRLCVERSRTLMYLGYGAMFGGLLALVVAADRLFVTYGTIIAVLMAAGAVCSSGSLVLSFLSAMGRTLRMPHLPVATVAAGVVCVGCVGWAIAITLY